MNLTLKIWRQPDAAAEGAIHTYQLDDVSPDMSFLEMLDVLNEQLNEKGEDPIAFDHDCREGICGSCGLMINGDAHGPEVTTTCQLHMRKFADGATIDIEPWRAAAFPVVKYLVVDRSAFDRIVEAGGYISPRDIDLADLTDDVAVASELVTGCGSPSPLTYWNSIWPGRSSHFLTMRFKLASVTLTSRTMPCLPVKRIFNLAPLRLR